MYNLRAKCTNNNGASATYTWRNIDCKDEQEALVTARQWAELSEKQFKSNPDLPYRTKSIEVSLPSNELLWKEDYEHIREKVDLEMMCGAYD